MQKSARHAVTSRPHFAPPMPEPHRFGRYAKPANKVHLRLVHPPKVETFGWFGQHLRICAFIMVICPLIAIGAWGAQQVDYLALRTQSGLKYCASDAMTEFDACNGLPDGQIACKQKALEKMRVQVPICYPEAVAGFR